MCFFIYADKDKPLSNAAEAAVGRQKDHFDLKLLFEPNLHSNSTFSYTILTYFINIR